ncbi:thermonuclease family protein [Microbacterium sp. LRZ72]|uniref:thermonuclease family protein n=1 Tax=Microbacterium sp. LRZ72 TaxID=2942481 RepID=UPI0029BEC6C7|nr:thermonuclease family protein [Microbacterium sp. LRZ72]MDX2377216.1 thermonuclease family protein [Microbacterium sp. LRZ72]
MLSVGSVGVIVARYAQAHSDRLSAPPALGGGPVAQAATTVAVTSLGLVILLWIVRRATRPREMTPAEHRTYYRQLVARGIPKPERLSWTGEAVPTRQRANPRQWWIARTYRHRPRTTTIVAGALIAVMVSVVSLGVGATPSYADDGSVVDVVDGDTVDIQIGDTVERVRLLNVDAPENNKASRVSECLGPEATAEMERLLPAGSRVTVIYDVERRDNYGRLLAGVENADGELVNAELAQAGLGGPLVVGANSRFHDRVRDASIAAENDKRGAFGTDIACTPGSIISTYESESTSAVADSLPEDSAALATIAATALAVSEAGDSAVADLGEFDWLGPDRMTPYIERVREAQQTAATHGDVAEERHAEAKADEERAAERAAEEAAAQEKAAREEAARQAERDSAPRSGDSDSNSRNSGGGGGSTYTGCRNYNGTGMIDDKGRSFQPIPCS